MVEGLRGVCLRRLLPLTGDVMQSSAPSIRKLYYQLSVLLPLVLSSVLTRSITVNPIMPIFAVYSYTNSCIKTIATETKYYSFLGNEDLHLGCNVAFKLKTK